MYKVKNSKICNFWTFWPVIQLINHLFLVRFWKDGIITELWTKISRSAVFASCIARILKENFWDYFVRTDNWNTSSIPQNNSRGFLYCTPCCPPVQKCKQWQLSDYPEDKITSMYCSKHHPDWEIKTNNSFRSHSDASQICQIDSIHKTDGERWEGVPTPR